MQAVRLTRWQQEQQPRIERELVRLVGVLGDLGAERVVLFGSHARGDFNEASDVDLVVVLDTRLRMVERVGYVLRVLDTDLSIEPLVYTPTEYARLMEAGSGIAEAVEREGRVLYERPG